MDDFAAKAGSARDRGNHRLLVELFPPGPDDSSGMRGAMFEQSDPSEASYVVPVDEPAALASYSAGPLVDIYFQHVGVGTSLPNAASF